MSLRLYLFFCSSQWFFRFWTQYIWKVGPGGVCAIFLDNIEFSASCFRGTVCTCHLKEATTKTHTRHTKHQKHPRRLYHFWLPNGFFSIFFVGGHRSSPRGFPLGKNPSTLQAQAFPGVVTDKWSLPVEAPVRSWGISRVETRLSLLFFFCQRQKVRFNGS